jgi:hypothetical protein
MLSGSCLLPEPAAQMSERFRGLCIVSGGQTKEVFMADNSRSGFLGVLVGALVVIALVVAVGFGTGLFGSKESASLRVEAPKVSTSK